MAEIRPFRAVRPANDKVHLVASRSYVTYSDEQLRDKLRNNPYSFVQIIHPDLNSDSPTVPGTTERFERVRDKYDEFVEEGIFQRDGQASYYVYRQTHEGLDSMGVIATASAEDYRNGQIKVHEQTLAQREALFAEYLEVTGFNAEPILLTHEDDEALNGWLMGVNTRAPEVHFTTADGVTHRLWRIDQEEEVAFLQERYAAMGPLYIADGHHRSASSVLLAEQLQSAGRADAEHPVNRFMVYIIPASRLTIHGYHRLIRDLGGIPPSEFLEAIKVHSQAQVTPLKQPEKLPGTGSILLYLDAAWYRIDFRDTVPEGMPDAAWLTEHILSPILGISDLRNDPRIAFEPETAGIETIAQLVDTSLYQCAFLLHPVPFEQMKVLSDQGQSMPPKSTWIEPKLRSGLVIYDFSARTRLSDPS